MFSHMACICHFVFYALPRASCGYIQCGFIPVQSGGLDAPTFICPHTFVHPPYGPILFCASVCFWRLCMLWGVVMGSPLCWDTLPYITPVWGCLPLNYTPTLSCWFPMHQYVSGISVCYVGISLLLKGLGVFPPSVGGWGASALEMSYAHSCTFFVVHYVSCFEYSSDYYSSSYSGIF